ncbi:MAG: PQQ-binding-like beta-propeller repeat protein [Planctomycetota bacterium]
MTPQGALPDRWDKSDYAWTIDLGSRDVGSVAISDGRVFYLTYVPASRQIAVNAADLKTGQVLWSKQYPLIDQRIHKRNTRASSTPTVDGDRVFAAWSDPEHTMLVAFDLKGNEVWKRDFGSWQSQHGFGTSPVVVDEKVILFNSQQADQIRPGQTPGQSRMIAVDRESGQTVWERPLKTTRACYGVPAVHQMKDGRKQLIASDTGNGLFGIDVQSGNLLWTNDVFRARCCSSPVLVGDIAIGTAGSGGGGNHLVAVRIPDAEQPTEELYRIEKNAPYVPSPALKDGLLFLVDDRGIASCVDAKDGSYRWVKRVGGDYGASPLIVDDRVLLISLDGKATLLEATDRYQQISRFDLGGPVGASPAYAEGCLILRIGDKLCCLRTREEA